MLRALDKLFGRLIRIGRTPEMTTHVARYVVLTNIVAILGVVFTVGFGMLLLVLGSPIHAGLQVLYALGYLPTLWLNKRGRHLAATTWMVLGGHLLVDVQVFVEGGVLDVQLFFLLHAVLPFLLYPPRHERLIFVLSAFAAADMLVMLGFADRLPQLGPDMPHLAIVRMIFHGGLFATLGACAYYARRATLLAEAALDLAHERSEELIHNILPASIATRLKLRDGTIADGYAEVTVLFADIVGFTTLSAKLPPKVVVEMLNDLFCTFDDLAGKLGLEKIKTIGDCYMVAGGLPEPRADHAEAIAEMALGMLKIVTSFSLRAHAPLQIRIGINSGPVVAGVIGKRKFIYDLWGDTVNTASRMESHGIADAIQISEASHRLLGAKYATTPRGEIDIKGKGPMQTWLLDSVRVEREP
jgi:class 3 adenylate cyclase